MFLISFSGFLFQYLYINSPLFLPFLPFYLKTENKLGARNKIALLIHDGANNTGTDKDLPAE